MAFSTALKNDFHKTFEVSNTIDELEKFAVRDTTYARLMAVGDGGHNSHFIASMIASWVVGDGCLPARLGLSNKTFVRFLAFNFPGVDIQPLAPKEEMDFDRLPERDDLIALMTDERVGRDDNELWIAEIVAAACMGMDHLWQDLGLWSRRELSEMLQYNFPALADRNDRDMKWKKFLYKQLCDKQGVYVCRSPSCDVCSDYNVCFGPEE